MNVGDIISLTKFNLKTCEDFARKRVKGSKGEYTRRGEADGKKIQQDIMIGAAGELAAFKYLKECGVLVDKPDFKIYDKNAKSFSADIVGKKYKFHVKSQGIESQKRYGNSWLLQRTDKVVTDPSEFEYFIFCNVDLPNVQILAIVKCADITNNGLYAECKVPRYRHSKVALYLDDLVDLDLQRF